MRRALLILTVLCIAIPAGVSNAQAELKSIQDVTRADPSAQDLKLTAAVKGALDQDASLHPALANIQLKTVDSIVSLKGTVASDAQLRAVMDRIRSVSGVSDVKSFVRVSGAGA